jgi:hypothetical protein
MTTTKTPAATLHDMIDDLAELGFMPADDYLSDTVDWFKAFAAVPVSHGWLIVAERVDEVYVALTTESGVIRDELRFNAPEGALSRTTAAALLAVLGAWS